MTRRLREWSGRRVFLTGASSGIGRALAIRLASLGARLALVARREKELCEAAAGCAGSPLVVPCDVGDRDAQDAAISRARSELGGIDVAVLNAGIGLHGALLGHTFEQSEQVLSVNVLGVIQAVHRIVPEMAVRKRGWVVFMASIAGLVPVPGEAVYSASKHAIVGLADALSIELEPHGVHVMNVCPGAVDNGFSRGGGPAAKGAKAATVSEAQVVDATLAGLAAGKHRVVVPSWLRAAVATRGIAPSLTREGTRRATKPTLT